MTFAEQPANTSIVLRRVDELSNTLIEQWAEVLIDCVNGGASARDDAERLYERMGLLRVGTIPTYALLPQGGFCDTILFYRVLSPAS